VPRGEFKNQDGVIVAPRFPGMRIGAHLGINRSDRRPAQHPAEELDRVATHVHRHAAAGAVHIPEMRGMRAIMFLRLLEQDRLTQRAAVQQLFESHVFRREAQLLGVHQFHARLAAGCQHSVGFGQVQAHRFLQNDMLAGRGGIHGDPAVKVVRDTDHDHVNFIQLQQFPIILEGVR